MTMKMRKTFSAAAIVAVLACSAAHAQVLGGNVGGALNGTLGGGLHDTSVLTNGNANGSFGGELDTGPAFDRVHGAADQTTRRARNAGANVRNRTESTVASARDTSANVVTSTAAAAKKDADAAPKLDSVTSDVNGSASGNAAASRDGVVADAAADAAGVASLDTKKQQDATPAPAPQPAPRHDRDTSKQ
jgi:hypothetical protein